MNELETVVAGLRWLSSRWYSDVGDELIGRIEDAAKAESPALPWLLNAGHMLIGSRGALAITFTEDAAPTGPYAELHRLLLRSAEWQEDIDAHQTAVALRKAASHVARAEALLVPRETSTVHANLHAGSAADEREFHCTSFGHRRRARVVGLGEGASTFLNSEGTGERRAQQDALKGLEMTLAIAPCPACGVRNRTALVRWWVRNLVAPVALFGGIMAALTFAPTYLDLGIVPEEQRKLAWAMLGFRASCCC